MVPGQGFSLSKRRPDPGVEEIRGLHPSNGPSPSIFPQSELQYLLATPIATRLPTPQATSQIRLGHEDAWLLLLFNLRRAPETPPSVVMGELLFELEEYFYPGGLLRRPWDVVELGVRDEAMIEEVGRMVLLDEVVGFGMV